MKRPVRAILWRRVNESTHNTLHGHSRGQYDIRLNTNERYEWFFEGLETHTPTDKGGRTIVVPVEPFEGEPPVPASTLEVRYIGPRSKRNDWYIRAQRPETAYPLWRPGRGVPLEFADVGRDVLLLIRDDDGNFHARYIDDEHFDTLPARLREHINDSPNQAGLWEAT